MRIDSSNDLQTSYAFNYIDGTILEEEKQKLMMERNIKIEKLMLKLKVR